MKRTFYSVIRKKSLYSPKIFLSLLLGFIISWFVKGKLPPILYGGTVFSARNLFYQFEIIFTYTLFFTIVSFFLVSLFELSFPKPANQLQQMFDGWNKSLIINNKKRIVLAIMILSIGFCSVLIINNMLSHINTNNWRYENPDIIPVINPIGNDFRVGLYWPAENLVKSGFKSIGPDGTYPSIYPPLVNVIFLPYLLLNDQKAYLVHVGLLILANIVCLVLASLMVKEFILSGLGVEEMYPAMIAVFIFFAMAIYTFSSYSFAFSMERGNCDAFAMLFVMLAMWALLTKPDKIWLQVILLSLAVHIKIYPAALFVLMLFKHGKKLILPALLVNVAFLFILGPKMALSFIQSVTVVGTGNGGVWVGNHGAHSFTRGIERISGGFLSPAFFAQMGIPTLIPLVLWTIAVIALIKNKYSGQNAILFLMVTIPVMDLVPTISNDYKSIILNSATVLLVALILKQIIQRHWWFDYVQLGVVILILLFISRPYAMSPYHPYELRETASFFINNKYLWTLALEGVMVWNIFENIITEKKTECCLKNGQIR